MFPRRILIFSTSYFPLIGGAEVSIKEITDRLPDIEFDLITAKQHKNLRNAEKLGNVTVYRLGLGNITLDKLLIPFLGAIKAIQLNKKRHYAAFWCIMVTFASGAAYIANWFQKKVPIILTLQEGDSEEWLRYRWLGLIDLSWRLALHRTAILTALSTYLLKRARKLGFRGNGFIIPNGVETERFANPAPKIMGDGIILLTVSRLVIKNGIEDVIKSMGFLPGNIKFKIAGIGILEKKLKSQVKRLGLENRVEFLGFISQAELPQLLHSADIFIRPSLSEGQGISFIEAMAAGLPVIATPVGGILDFLKDGETGLFCEVNNPESIAKLVSRLINDEALRERLIENGKKLVKERYDWDFIAKEIKERVFDLPAAGR